MIIELVDTLAQNNFGDTRSGGLAGPTGLVVILFLAIGTVLLIRNMNSRLRRLPASFDEPKPADSVEENDEQGSADKK